MVLFESIYRETRIQERFDVNFYKFLENSGHVGLYSLYKENGFTNMNNYVQNSGRFDEGFKDKLKKFGKKAALAGMLGLASLNGVSCANGSGDDDSYIEEESQEPEKTYTCSECGSQFDNESDANSKDYKHAVSCPRHTYYVRRDEIDNTKAPLPDDWKDYDLSLKADSEYTGNISDKNKNKLYTFCRDPYHTEGDMVFDDNEDGSVEDELAAHESEKYYDCDVCDEEFHTDEEKKAHRKVAHKGVGK